MKSTGGKRERILYGVLDWGIGHASRSIFFIQHELDKGHEVVIAAGGDALRLLREVFPGVRVVPMPFMRVRYSRWLPVVWKMLFRLPAFFRAVRRERRRVEALVAAEPFDRIVSDHRYGFRHPAIRSELVIHQLWFRLPRGWHWLEPWVFRMHRRWLKHFDRIIVPDKQEMPGLAGLLSHPPGGLGVLNDKVEYAGIVSRFLLPSFCEDEQPVQGYDILVVLSGPEPQRTVLEDLLVRRFRRGSRRVLVVRGRPGRRGGGAAGKHVRLVSHLPAGLLCRYLRHTPLIIARAGYSSVMDLVALGRTALLIPTPGQTEQEYLAEHLSRAGRFVAMEQKALQGRGGGERLARRLQALEELQQGKEGDDPS